MDSVEPIFNPDRVAKTSEFTAMTWWIQTLMGFLHVFLIVRPYQPATWLFVKHGKKHHSVEAYLKSSTLEWPACGGTTKEFLSGHLRSYVWTPTPNHLTLIGLVSNKTTIDDQGYYKNSIDLGYGRVGQSQETISGEGGNRDCHRASSSLLNISADEAFTISSGSLFQYGTTRTLSVCWRRRVLYHCCWILKTWPRSPMRVGSAKTASHGKSKRPCHHGFFYRLGWALKQVAERLAAQVLWPSATCWYGHVMFTFTNLVVLIPRAMVGV